MAVIISQFGSRVWSRQNRLVVRLIRTMSRQSKMFDCATHCEWLMELSSDLGQKETFRQLRDMWITLAKESTGVSVQELAEAFISIEAIQSGLKTKPTLQ